jgi:IMP dehydrogenase
MVTILGEALTFDDVLMVPAHSDIATRSEISLEQEFLGEHLGIPILSANMDYITESAMIMAMHKSGGLGVMHRFLEWDRLEQEITSLLIDRCYVPLTLSVGIRDIDESVRRAEWLMTLPGAYGHQRIIVIDVAHGFHEKVADLIMIVKRYWPQARVIAGNVATSSAAHFLLQAGADAIKVGIGPGSVCTTRTVTGVGIPQLTAIINCAHAAQSYLGAKVIADGGIRNSGDIVKALAAGADVVMLGHLLAGTTETPGKVLIGPDGTSRWKPYRGQSIFGSNGERFTKEGISGYVREKGPVSQVLDQLIGGIRSGMSYVGARNLSELREDAIFTKVSPHTNLENSTRVSEVMV